VRGALLFIAIFALSMLIIPMIALSYQSPPATPPPIESILPIREPALQPDLEPQPDLYVGVTPPSGPPTFPVEIDLTPEQEGFPFAGVSTVSHFQILDERTGEIHIVSLRDYVRGAVVAEMPASFHPEALKAQAVAAHTFALHHHLSQQSRPDPGLRGADFSADPQNRWGYMTEEMAMEFLGPHADEHWARITAAVDSVLHLIVKHDGEPIVAAYHAMSAGRTEYASNVWVGSAPYLIPALSEGDLLAPGFETHETRTADQFRSAILAAHPEVTLSGEPVGWLDILELSSSGYVTGIQVGDTRLHGLDVRRALYLRSHHFDVDYSSGNFTFTVRGYGHGVGLSQRGADFMARQGYAFDEILAHYYPGTGLYQVALFE